MSTVRLGMRYNLSLTHPDGTSRNWSVTNLVPDVGMEYILNNVFLAGVESPTWYLGLCSEFTVASESVLADVEAVEITDYTGASRAAWTVAYPTTPTIIDNSESAAVFTFDATPTDMPYNVFLTDSEPHGGTTGTLMSVASLGGAVSVVNGSVLRIVGQFILNPTPET